MNQTLSTPTLKAPPVISPAVTPVISSPSPLLQNLSQGSLGNGEQTGSMVSTSGNDTSTPSYFVPSSMPIPASSSINSLAGSSTFSTSPVTHPGATDGTTIQGQYGLIHNINGGTVYSDPRDNPNYIAPPTNYTPQNFSVTPTTSGSIPSTSLGYGNGTTVDDLVNKNTQNIAGLTNGQNPTGIPSDNLLGEVANNVYNSSLYTPEETAGMTNLANLNTQISGTQLAAMRQIQQMQEDGSITKDQATAFLSEANRRNSETLANLGFAQTAQTNALGVLGQLRGNNLTANQNLAGMLAPTAVAPGSTEYNPITGPSYSAMGASPSQINSTAMQYAQLAQQQGTLQYNQDGSINMQPYIQAAQQFYSTGSTNGPSSQSSGETAGAPGGTQQNANLPGWTPQSDGSYTNQLGYSINGQAAQKVAQIPQQFQGYVQGGPLGVAYINDDLVPSSLKTAVQAKAAAAGVKYLTSSEVGGVQAIDSILQNLQLMNVYSKTALSSGFMGRLAGLTTNQAMAYLQTGPKVADPVTGQQVPLGTVLQNFNQFKDAAGKAVTALAGGQGSGLHMNMSLIENAVNNLPTSSDSLEGAQTKISGFAAILMNQFSSQFPSVAGQDPLAGVQSAGIQQNTNSSNSSSSIYNF